MIRFLFLFVFLFPSIANAQLITLSEIMFEEKVSKKEISDVSSSLKSKMESLNDVDFFLKTQLKGNFKNRLEFIQSLTEIEKDIAVLTIVEDFSHELKAKEADISVKSLKCTTIKNDGENASLPDLCVFLLAIQNYRKELALRQENLVIYTFNKHSNEFSDFEKAHYLKKIQTWNDQEKLIERKK